MFCRVILFVAACCLYKFKLIFVSNLPIINHRLVIYTTTNTIFVFAKYGNAHRHNSIEFQLSINVYRIGFPHNKPFYNGRPPPPPCRPTEKQTFNLPFYYIQTYMYLVNLQKNSTVP